MKEHFKIYKLVARVENEQVVSNGQLFCLRRSCPYRDLPFTLFPVFVVVMVVENTMEEVVRNKVLSLVGCDCPDFFMEWDASPSCSIPS